MDCLSCLSCYKTGERIFGSLNPPGFSPKRGERIASGCTGPDDRRSHSGNNVAAVIPIWLDFLTAIHAPQIDLRADGVKREWYVARAGPECFILWCSALGALNISALRHRAELRPFFFGVICTNSSFFAVPAVLSYMQAPSSTGNRC